MTLWKKSAVGAAALMLAGSMMVYAQQRPEGPAVQGPGGFGGPGIWRPSPEDMGAFVDARIAALHAGLRLNPDQEKTWPAFEQALRESARLRMERRAAEHNEPPAAGPVERLQRRADAMTTRGTARSASPTRPRRSIRASTTGRSAASRCWRGSWARAAAITAWNRTIAAARAACAARMSSAPVRAASAATTACAAPAACTAARRTTAARCKRRSGAGRAVVHHPARTPPACRGRSLDRATTLC